MLSIEDLEVRYGNLVAVRGVSLAVAEGELVGLIGPNGAGKTSTLSAVAGAVSPSRGSITLFGKSIPRGRPELAVQEGIALVPEGRRIFGTLTVGENLQLGGTSRRDGQIALDLDRMLERFPALGRYRDSAAGKLSGGEQQQLAIARALMSRPRLLLMDEPSLGLAPMMVRAVFELLTELKRDGITTLLVEQNARRTLTFADRTYVIQAGSIRLETSPKNVDIPTVERQYFGVETGVAA